MDKIEEKVFAILADVTKRTVADLMAARDDTDLWNSFCLVEIVLAIEIAFSIYLDENDIAGLKTPADIMACVVSKMDDV